ncbi:glutamine--fructose-6-phosphate transaminase (isomerizing) [Thermophilibacter sp. ET337]|uniref:glutamine--fructose-6-phosphate transaminase (isomerizing) n=1 Tax=Thermophilibacter sp. ET337 TaxID=2973084 RepID=UPI0021ABC243|nr:glutamine--fructose-6-phosphate transaminase (isomerizing) [Thermophilibacter sp. ET337]MCR8907881.1 glutamine--fructose-6-phosphate transaminase (isomerizing) [Thermophilibacter sp. ET337]
MCGIVGYTGSSQAIGYLLEGLKTLEYRGYDSAGVAVLGTDGALHGVKCAGRVATLVERCETANLVGTTGIAHTRWATHGAPTDRNSHPHRDCSGRIAVVHNGIIENYRELRAYLQRGGHTLVSETDSEVIAHLIEDAWAGPSAGNLVGAVRNAVRRLEGSWALAVVCADAPGEIVCARNGSPLVVASTSEGAYAASDVTPLASVTSHVIQLENGQLARLEQGGRVTVFDAEGAEVDVPSTIDIDWDASAATLGGYADFMAKEIAEQPEAIERLLSGRMGAHGVTLDELSMTGDELASVDRVYLIACGTSYHVSLIARTLIQTWAKVPVICDYASEFNYENDVLVTPHTLGVVITQSGETADTLTAARRLKGMGCKVFAITNVLGSTAARESDGVLYVQAGPEVCVASTKAYTAQMVASALLALRLAEAQGQMERAEVERRYGDLCRIPDLIREVISRSWQDKRAAQLFRRAHSALFLGRGVNATTALEGALKLKEISYLHAEAYPAGEMKHGPIALLEPGFPVVAIVPEDRVHDKTVSNIQEVIARGAVCVAVATDGDEAVASLVEHVLWIPHVPDELLVPIVAVVHLQMLARHVALLRGCDVDKPRNLAKSVTVE